MGERIFAGTQEGLQVWRSLGGAWEEVAVELAQGTVDAIDGPRSAPGTVYASVAGQGLCRSDDGGHHWRTVFQGNVRAVTVDPSDPKVVYVGTEPIELYRSEDEGKTWEKLSALQQLPQEVRAKWTYPRPPHREHVRHIFVSSNDPENIYVCLEHLPIPEEMMGEVNVALIIQRRLSGKLGDDKLWLPPGSIGLL